MVLKKDTKTSRLLLVPADKALRVKLPEHGGDAPALDWLVTPGAQAAAQTMVVGLTVRAALLLKKLSVPERLPTLLAHKTFWMPLKEKDIS